MLDFTLAQVAYPCLIKYHDVPNSITKFYLQIVDKKLTATFFPLLFQEANAWPETCALVEKIRHL